MRNLLSGLRPGAVTDFALLCGSGLLAWGLWQYQTFAQFTFARTRDALQFAVAASLLAWLLGRVLRLDFTRSLAGVLVVAHGLMLGVASSAATLLLALAALSLGTLLVSARCLRTSAIALLVGLALIAAGIGWTLPLKVHYAGVYGTLAIGLIVWRRQPLWAALQPALALWRTPSPSSWESALAMLVVAYAATAAWLPTTQFDDLVYHLGLPWQLAENATYRFDPDTVAWGLSPWAGDVLQAVAQLLAGVEARGAVDTLWLLLAVTLLWQMLAALALSPRWRWLAVALYASQPMTHGLMQSMQTELPTAALVLACAALLIDATLVEDARRRLFVLAILGGCMLALKVSTLAFLGPLAVWLLISLRPLRIGSAIGATVLLVAVGGASYFYATVLSGNPVLPLFNDIFQSPDFLLERQTDWRFHGLATWTAPFDLVVDSSRHTESWDGAGGWQWLAALFALLLAIRQRPAGALILVGLSACTLLYLQIQYLRYLYPALALWSVALPLILAHDEKGPWRRLTVVALVAGNVAAMSNVIWTVRDPPMAVWARHGTSTPAEYLRTTAPERLLLRHLRETRGRDYSVLMITEETPYIAEAAGHALSNSWYDPKLRARLKDAANDPSGSAYLSLFHELGLTHLTLRNGKNTPALTAAILHSAALERREGLAELYRLERPSLAVAGLPTDGSALSFPLRLEPIGMPSTGAVAIEIDAHFSCTPVGAAVALRVEAAGRVIAQDYRTCGNGQTLVLQARGSAPTAAGMVLWLDGSNGSAQMRSRRFEVRVRNDLGASRDRREQLVGTPAS